ncbi:conserved hypothetical protein, partial [Coccidioides posadasii str. Silveira]
MAPCALTSHHVNYLIWRQAMGKRQLCCSAHGTLILKGYPSLLTLIQKGLQYYDIEKSLDQNGNPISVSDVSFFGPSTAHPSIIVGIGDSVKAKDAEIARKPEPASEAFVHAAPKPDGEINGQSPKANIQPIAKKGAEASEPEGITHQ